MSSSIEVVESLDEVRPIWSDLAAAAGNIFSTWEWASTWWRHYGGSSSVRVVLCGDSALLPLYLWSRGPVRVARFIGHGPADQLGPVCTAESTAAAAAAIVHAPTVAGADVVLAELLPGAGDWPLLGRPLVSEQSPTIVFDGGWDAYLSTRSRNLREQLGRRERQLRRRHRVEFRRSDDPERLAEDLTLLFGLHRARWSDRSPFLRFEAFHRDFARVAQRRGWLRLWFLELDGRTAAAWYGFRFGGSECYYQAGRDVSLEGASVGLVLLAHSIKEAAADGMSEYRLLRGGEQFKLRLANADAGVATYAVGRGVRGALGRAAAAAALRSSVLRGGLGRLRR
jgi:CelD/BcsL family acetyltransferase involved in cellulose biosynthesis